MKRWVCQQQLLPRAVYTGFARRDHHGQAMNGSSPIQDHSLRDNHPSDVLNGRTSPCMTKPHVSIHVDSSRHKTVQLQATLSQRFTLK
jgi:hypothetical protein